MHHRRGLLGLRQQAVGRGPLHHLVDVVDIVRHQPERPGQGRRHEQGQLPHRPVRPRDQRRQPGDLRVHQRWDSPVRGLLVVPLLDVFADPLRQHHQRQSPGHGQQPDRDRRLPLRHLRLHRRRGQRPVRLVRLRPVDQRVWAGAGLPDRRQPVRHPDRDHHRRRGYRHRHPHPRFGGRRRLPGPGRRDRIGPAVHGHLLPRGRHLCGQLRVPRRLQPARGVHRRRGSGRGPGRGWVHRGRGRLRRRPRRHLPRGARGRRPHRQRLRRAGGRGHRGLRRRRGWVHRAGRRLRRQPRAHLPRRRGDRRPHRQRLRRGGGRGAGRERRRRGRVLGGRRRLRRPRRRRAPRRHRGRRPHRQRLRWRGG